MNDLNLQRNRERLITLAVQHTNNYKEAGAKLGLSADAVQKAYNKIKKRRDATES